MYPVIDELDCSEHELLNPAVGDDVLERAAGNDPARAANPTVPSAIICIPFASERTSA